MWAAVRGEWGSWLPAGAGIRGKANSGWSWSWSWSGTWCWRWTWMCGSGWTWAVLFRPVITGHPLSSPVPLPVQHLLWIKGYSLTLKHQGSGPTAPAHATFSVKAAATTVGASTTCTLGPAARLSRLTQVDTWRRLDSSARMVAHSQMQTYTCTHTNTQPLHDELCL